MTGRIKRQNKHDPHIRSRVIPHGQKHSAGHTLHQLPPSFFLHQGKFIVNDSKAMALLEREPALREWALSLDEDDRIYHMGEVHRERRPTPPDMRTAADEEIEAYQRGRRQPASPENIEAILTFVDRDGTGTVHALRDDGVSRDMDIAIAGLTPWGSPSESSAVRQTIGKRLVKVLQLVQQYGLEVGEIDLRDFNHEVFDKDQQPLNWFEAGEALKKLEESITEQGERQRKEKEGQTPAIPGNQGPVIRHPVEPEVTGSADHGAFTLSAVTQVDAPLRTPQIEKSARGRA